MELDQAVKWPNPWRWLLQKGWSRNRYIK